MLVLSRKKGEKIRLTIGGEEVWVTLVRINGNQARIGIDADPSVKILRGELIEVDPHETQRTPA